MNDLAVFVVNKEGHFKQYECFIPENTIVKEVKSVLDIQEIVTRLPKYITKIAWIDNNLIFSNKYWYQETSDLLERCQVCQLFENVFDIDDCGRITSSTHSLGHNHVNKCVGNSEPRFAWAGKREWVEELGILDGYNFAFVGDFQSCPDEISRQWCFNIKRKVRVCGCVHGSVLIQNYKQYKKPIVVREDGVIARVNVDIQPAKQRESFSCDVIIPYNGPNYNYLEEAIKSILNQNFVTVTLHLINDGMPEDEIGDKYGKLDNVRQYMNVEAVGPYITYSRLFKYLEHNHIAMQDSDDIALPMRLYKSMLLMDKYDIVGGTMEQFTNYWEGNRMRKALSMKPYHYSGLIYKSSPFKNIVNGTAMMKKSVFEECNGMAPWKAGADTEFYTRAIMAGYKAVAMEDIVSLRRLHDPSLSNNQVTSGHGTKFREQIMDMTLDSIEIQKKGPDHSIGGLNKHKHDTDLIKLN